MSPEEISRQYDLLLDTLCADVTDVDLLYQINHVSDDFFRRLALSIWHRMGVTPSMACLEAYGRLYTDGFSLPPSLDAAAFSQAIAQAPALAALPPLPYLESLIALDANQAADAFDLDALLQRGGDLSAAYTPLSLSFLSQCAAFSRSLAELLQDPCPADVLQEILCYWDRLSSRCIDAGADPLGLYQLRQISTAMDTMEDADEARISQILSGTADDAQLAESRRLDARNQQEMARAAAEQQAAAAPTLEELLDQLHSLCGMELVKKEVQQQMARVRMQKLRQERGKRQDPVSLHMAFLGNPGTGKTTVARLMGQLYHAMGVLSRGQLVEVDRSGLVAEYIGHTEKKTQSAINRAMGGVLFVDEAYALAGRGDSDFGREAIEVLLKNMEDRREDLMVIVAGYPTEMKAFLRSNPGLESRFKTVVHFDDYTGPELLEIFRSFCEKNDYILTPQADAFALDYFQTLYARRSANFGNARDVRNFYEWALDAKALREFTVRAEDCNDEISLEDVTAAAAAAAERSL